MATKIVAFLSLLVVAQALPPGVKIVGGVVAGKHELPYQVSIRYYDNHICGGTIITKNYVVTSAKCVEGDKSKYLIAAGEHSLSRDDGTEQVRAIGTLIIHENYDSWSVANDIALIRLNASLALNEEVQTLAIADSGHKATGLGLVSGWGALSDGGSQPDLLYKVQVPIVTDEICRKSYGKDEIEDSMICAGYSQGGRDACKEDAGGPLVCTDNGYPYLAGIVSWARGCALPNFPGVYTEVAYFSTWIAQIIAATP